MGKRFLCAVSALITALAACFSTACGDKTPTTETVTVYGEFYTVQEAYDNKLLTLDDFAFIEKNEKTPENYVALDDETRSKIHDDYYATHALVGDDMQMINYGSYNGCRAVFVQDMYYDIFFDTLERIPWKYYKIENEKGERTFYSIFFWRLRIWKEYDAPMEKEKPSMPNGVFLSLKQAYELGYLTRDQLQQIANGSCSNDNIIDQETEAKIIRDYKALDMETDFNRIKCHGVYRDNIVLHVWDYCFFDPLGQGFNINIDGIWISEIVPLLRVWIPIEKIKAEII